MMQVFSKNVMRKTFSKSFSQSITKQKEDKIKTDFFNSYFESNLNFRKSADKFKCFRVMGTNGEILNPEYENIPKDVSLKIFKTMVQVKEYDKRFNVAQREGKISFYMTCTGEEASIVSSAAALSDEDMIYPQYREVALLLYRGYTIQEMANQLIGNYMGHGKGRQMPIHYGSKKLNVQTISSPLATQIPQASGAGYHFRVRKMNKLAVTYFGDGTASEGDFHAALNFASVLESQTLFFCRNNMYAISTPIDDQYNGDGIAIRGIAYGMNSIRVDGNDVFAVYNAVKAAREYIIQTGGPVLIESMSYRVGDHSTSDFSAAYRDSEEMNKWIEYLPKIGEPISRFYNYLLNKQWVTEKEYIEMIEEAKEQVRNSLKEALKMQNSSIDSLFEDVYEKVPPHLEEQKQQLMNHLKIYPNVYNLDQYKAKE